MDLCLQMSQMMFKWRPRGHLFLRIAASICINTLVGVKIEPLTHRAVRGKLMMAAIDAPWSPVLIDALGTDNIWIKKQIKNSATTHL